jgi:hypothetical protein
MGVVRIIAAGAMALAGSACLYVVGDDDHHEAGWSACDVPSDCTLAADGCCDACGRPTVADVDAVNRGRLDEHFADVCPLPVPCPLCPVAINPELLATCRLDHCRALDVRALSLSACSVDGDCRLRATGCCECGASVEPWNLIAIAVAGEIVYQQLVCDPGQVCADCMPLYPETVEAYCADDGHCAVREAVRACTDAACTAQGLTCCTDGCTGTYDDIFNCGACGNVCGGAHPFCDGVGCAAAPPCTGGTVCAPPTFCCGGACCAPGELCCDVPGPGPGLGPRCVPPDARGTCPTGCPLCQ